MTEFITGTTGPKPKRPDQELALLGENGRVKLAVFPAKPCPAMAISTWGKGTRGMDATICTGECFGCDSQTDCGPHNNYKVKFPQHYAQHQILNVLKQKPE
jgi:hypothetical protein